MLNKGVLAAVLATAIEMSLVLGGAPTWAMLPFGILLVFVLPGFVWLMVFRSDQTSLLGGVLISAMSSIGIVIVTGLIIDAFPAGLTARNQVSALALVVAVGALTGWATGAHRRAPQAALRLHAPSRPTAIKTLATMGCVAGVAVLSLSSQHAVNAGESFTVLSLADTRTIHPSASVASHQRRSVSYQLSVTTDGDVRETRHVVLAPGQVVHEGLGPYLTDLAAGSTVRVTLTRPGSSKPFRQVWFATAG